MKKKKREENVKNIELPIKIDMNSKHIKERTHERRMELLNLVKVRGFIKARLQYKALAAHYEISERQIYTDFNWIKGNYKPADLREVKIDLRIGRDRALGESLKLMEDAKKFDEKAKAIDTLMNVMKRYREEAEAWGEKEKVADKHQFEGLAGTFNLIEKSVEEIKNERSTNKGEKANNKPKTKGNSESSR